MQAAGRRPSVCLAQHRAARQVGAGASADAVARRKTMLCRDAERETEQPRVETKDSA